MDKMHLGFFTQDSNDPFFIQYGHHDTLLNMHTHTDFSELVIVMNGTAMHQVDNEAYLIQKGDVFVISQHTAHGYKNPENFQICNIMYPPERLLSITSDIRTSSGFHALFVIEPYLTMEHHFKSHLKLSFADFEIVNGMTDLLMAEYAQKKDGWRTVLDSQFMLLVVFLSRVYSQTSFHDLADAIHIAKSVSHMESHFTAPLTIQELANLSNLSVRHFSRLFYATYHMTPGQYILNLRMQFACLLLKETVLTITEISERCGFSDSNFFARQFRKVFQMSPRDYRKVT